MATVAVTAATAPLPVLLPPLLLLCAVCAEGLLLSSSTPPTQQPSPSPPLQPLSPARLASVMARSLLWLSFNTRFPASPSKAKLFSVIVRCIPS